MQTLSTELLFDKLPRQQDFEQSLWNVADKLRANAKLEPSAYRAPVLALLFLRYAAVKQQAVSHTVFAEISAGGRNARTEKDIYLEKCGFYLPEKARYDYLLALDANINASVAVKEAIEDFDKENPDLEKILPRNEFLEIPNELLRDLIYKLAELRMDDGDRFGKIYEYFVSQFSALELQKGGEFYTPQSIVKLIVEFLEPHGNGKFYDPACGTGGMFVQSAKFVQRNHEPQSDMSIFGQENKTVTANLAKLNLTINGLRNEIKDVETSLSEAIYTNPNHFPVQGTMDYVMANPPFNADEVTVASVGTHPLFTTYGLPMSTTKGKSKSTNPTFGNANYLWISLFANALKPTGRAGFVMANSASDARGNEAEMRKNMIEDGLVDIMVAVSSNFFYTVTLPVTVWFFDKTKTTDPERKHKTLFIDARKVFTQVTRSQREFTHAQLQNLAAMVWLYRGETDKYNDLIQKYTAAIAAWREGGIVETGEGIYKIDEPVLPKGETYKALADYNTDFVTAYNDFVAKLNTWLNAGLFVKEKAYTLPLLAAEDLAALNTHYKTAEDAAKAAEADRPKADKTFAKSDIKTALRTLNDARKIATFVHDRITYFTAQRNWLTDRFPDATWQDIEGLCKIADIHEIREQGYSLNPGRYVGVAIEDDGMTADDFRAFLTAQADTLATLHTEAQSLHTAIADDIRKLNLVTEKEVADA